MAELRPVVVKTFTGPTQASAAGQFAADAVEAARHGYTPASQAWDGTTLTVVYQRQAPEPAKRDPLPREVLDWQPAKPSSVNVSQSAAGLGAGVGQGFGLGFGCLLSLIVLVAACVYFLSGP